MRQPARVPASPIRRLSGPCVAAHRTRRSLAFRLAATAVALAAPIFVAAALVTPSRADAAAAGAQPTSGSLSARAEDLLKAANSYWAAEIRTVGSGSYDLAHISWFSGSVKGACGASGALTGPFYCPSNEHIYLDRAYLAKLAHQPGASQELALAYLIGHELGHHIQLLDGRTAQVEQARSRSSPQLSARLWATQELQADCYAGLWLRSAAAHGVVTLDKSLAATVQAVSAVSHADETHLPAGTAMPDPVATYSTEAQRSHWLDTGLSSGRIQDCDTFSAASAGTS